MPKKFTGENSKVVEAKVRKEAAKSADRQRKEEAAEEEFWKDEDDKSGQKKTQRKEEKEKKRLEQLNKKATLRNLAEEEISSIKVESKQAPSKITRLQIQAEQEKREAAARKSTTAKAPAKVQSPVESIPENVNRIVVEGETARTIEEAIEVLAISPADSERHPEKRMKAAFTAFEEANLPRLKLENPGMRLSQLKQLLQKEWLKSPDNPFNMKTSRYNNK